MKCKVNGKKIGFSAVLFMSTTGIIIEKTLHFFNDNPNDSNIGKDNNKTENQRNLQNSPEIFDAITSKMNKLNEKHNLLLTLLLTIQQK